MVRCSVLQCVAACCIVLLRVVVCCSVLQCVATWCSVLQRVRRAQTPAILLCLLPMHRYKHTYTHIIQSDILNINSNSRYGVWTGQCIAVWYKVW